MLEFWSVDCEHRHVSSEMIRSLNVPPILACLNTGENALFAADPLSTDTELQNLESLVDDLAFRAHADLFEDTN